MRVLITDDETNTILLIRNPIDRQKTDMEAARETGGGTTTLEMVRQPEPGVVITDIRTSGMNGMDLIRHVREEQIPTGFVIINGYSELEYARNAVQYDISDYLLELIKKDELNDVLTKLESQRASKKEQQMQLNLMEGRLASNNEIPRKNLLRNLPTGNGELFRQALGTGKVKDIFDYRGSFFTVVAVKLDCMSGSECRVPEQAVETIAAKVMRKLRACCHETEFITSRSWGYICLSYNGRGPALGHICSELGEILERAEYENDLFGMTMGIGSRVSPLEHLPDSLKTAVKSIMLRINLRMGNIIRYNCLSENYKKDSYHLPKESEVKMERRVPLPATGKPVLTGEEAANRMVEGQYRCYRLYGLLEEVLERTGLVFSDIMKDYRIPDAEPYIRHLENCTTLSQLELVWVGYISVNCELCQKQKGGMEGRPMRMIKEYIGEHHNENITLNDIADIVFLNPAYFSVMFKRETGQVLTQYLIDVRIDKAREMFRNPEKTIGEIVCIVGYRDRRHFSRLFSKITGVKPAEYRRFYV